MSKKAVGTAIDSITVELFNVPLAELLVDAKHGSHTHFELIVVNYINISLLTCTGCIVRGITHLNNVPVVSCASLLVGKGGYCGGEHWLWVYLHWGAGWSSNSCYVGPRFGTRFGGNGCFANRSLLGYNELACTLRRPRWDPFVCNIGSGYCALGSQMQESWRASDNFPV